MPVTIIKLKKQRKDGKPRYRACWTNPYQRHEPPAYKVHWDMAWLKEWGRQMDAQARDDVLNPTPEPQAATLAETTTFATFVDVWRDTRLTAMQPRTISRYEGVLKNYLSPAFGPMLLRDIDKESVRTYFATLTRQHKPHGHCTGAPHPATALRKVQVTLSSILSEAVDLEYLQSNPAAKLRLLKPLPTDEMLYLTEEELRAVAEAIDPRYRTLIYVAGYRGLRSSELWALRRRDVDIATRQLHVRRALKSTAPTPLFGPPKNGKARSVRLSGFLADMLADHLATLAGDGYGDDDELVFQAPFGGVVRHELFRRRFFQPAIRKAVAAHSIPTAKAKLRVHDLRHSAAAIYAANGATLEQVRDMLGHSDTRTTARYHHLFARHDDPVLAAEDAAYRAMERSHRHLHAVDDTEAA